MDCALHMFITTPLPKFIDSPIKEHIAIATRKSTWTAEPYEELNKRVNTTYIAYCESPQQGPRDLLTGNGVLRIQRCPNPGAAYLTQCGLLLDGVGPQVGSKSCCCRQYTTHPWHTYGGYQKMVRWVVDGHASPDVHADV